MSDNDVKSGWPQYQAAQYMIESLRTELASKKEELDNLNRYIAIANATILRLSQENETLRASQVTSEAIVRDLAGNEVGRKKNDRRCGECNKPIESGQPVGLYYGAHCHLNCVARARDAE